MTAEDKLITAADKLLAKIQELGATSHALSIKKNGEHIYHAVNSRISLMSVSKELIKYEVANLIKNKKLALDTKIIDYLSDTDDFGNMIYKFYDYESWSEITIYHLLYHSSGIPDFMSYIDLYAHLSPVTIINTVSKLPLHFSPGKDRKYSNTNYFILDYIIKNSNIKDYAPFEYLSNISKTIRKAAFTDYCGFYVNSQHQKNPCKGWSSVFYSGLFTSTAEDLHNLIDIISKDKELVNFFTPDWNFIKHDMFANYHTVVGLGSIGHTCIHSSNLNDRTSIVLYCNLFGDDITNISIDSINDILKY